MRKLWPGLLAIALAAGFGIMNLSRLPATLPVQWDLRGEVSSTGSSQLVVYGLPALALAIALLLTVLPKVDPRRANFPQYEGTWWLIGNAVLTFMAVVHVLVVGSGLGWNIAMPMVVGMTVGGLFVVIGNYLTRVRPNWFLGIRTPWTLSSEKSWRETHRLGGTLFVLGGLLLIVVTALKGTLAMWALALGVGVPVVTSVVYSFFVWRQDHSTLGNGAQHQ
jgi:uncharacterized membrane protein